MRGQNNLPKPPCELSVNSVLTSHRAFINTFLTTNNSVRIAVINSGHFVCSVCAYSSALRLP